MLQETHTKQWRVRKKHIRSNGEWQRVTSTGILPRTIGQTHSVVVLTKRRGTVNHTSATVGCYVSVRNHPECTLLFQVDKVRQQRLVPLARQRLPLDLAKDLKARLVLFAALGFFGHGAGDVRHAALCDDEHRAVGAVGKAHIVKFGVDAQGQIAGQRPWGGGPCHHHGAVGVVFQCEAHLAGAWACCRGRGVV